MCACWRKHWLMLHNNISSSSWSHPLVSSVMAEKTLMQPHPAVSLSGLVKPAVFSTAVCCRWWCLTEYLPRISSPPPLSSRPAPDSLQSLRATENLQKKKTIADMNSGRPRWWFTSTSRPWGRKILKMFLPLFPCITLFRPLISLIDDLVALLLLPPLPLVVVPDVTWLWLCKSVWVCVELNKEWIVASWLLSGLETWFLGGPMVGGPGLRWVNGRDGKCSESVFCCSTVKRKSKY